MVAWLAALSPVKATEIFSNGFEEGDFSEWTGVTGSPTVQSGIVHTGTYALEADLHATGYTRYTADKTLGSAYSEWYARAYFRISTLPSSGNSLYLMWFWDPSGTLQARLDIYHDGGIVKWKMSYRNGGGWQTAYVTDPAPVVDTWFCLEMHLKLASGTGLQNLYINDVLKSENIGLDNDDQNAYVQRVSVGLQTEGWGSDGYVDCVVVADAYIGPEEEGGGEEYSFELSETCAVTADLFTQKNMHNTLTETVTVTGSATTTKTLTRSLDGSVTVTTTIETQKDLGAMFTEMLETVSFTANFYTDLIVEITTSDLIGLIIVFFVIGISVSLALVIAYKKNS